MSIVRSFGETEQDIVSSIPVIESRLAYDGRLRFRALLCYAGPARLTRLTSPSRPSEPASGSLPGR